MTERKPLPDETVFLHHSHGCTKCSELAFDDDVAEHLLYDIAVSLRSLLETTKRANGEDYINIRRVRTQSDNQ